MSCTDYENVCRLVTCPVTDDIPSYLGSYSLQSGLSFTNKIISVPNGGGFYYVPAGMFNITTPTASQSYAYNIAYQGCRSTINQSVPAGANTEQVLALVNLVMQQAAAQLLICNNVRPLPPIPPPRPAPPNSLITGLLVYYKFNEVSGTRYDVNGANPLFAVNGPIPSAPGIIGLAADLSPDSSYPGADLESPGVNALWPAPGSPFSLSFWIKTDAGNFSFLLVNNTVSGYDQYGVTVNVGFVSWFPLNGFAEASVPTDGNFHHIVGTCDLPSGNINLYVDSVLAATGTGAVAAPAPNSGDIITLTTIGGIGYGTFLMLDEMGLWSRVLSQTDVNQLYNGGAGLTYPF